VETTVVKTTKNLMKEISDASVRGKKTCLPIDSTPLAGRLYSHQSACLEQLKRQPINGIVHLPTGAGKTRLALAFIADTLAADPDHLFIWVTYPNQLLKQALARCVEYSGHFPKKMQMLWYHHKDNHKDSLSGISMVFMLRDQLTQLLNLSCKAKSPLRQALSSDAKRRPRSATLIFDECHLMGAVTLRRAFKKFFKATANETSKLRIIGLSATPIPSDQDAFRFFRRDCFPLSDRFPSVVQPDSSHWGVHLFHQVTADELRREKVLCKAVATHSSNFKIPKLLFESVSGRQFKDPGDKKNEHKIFSQQFNRHVMGHRRLIRYIARRLARFAPRIGKTIVFMPNIKSAEKLRDLLSECSNIGPEKVFLVHSGELDGGGRSDKATVSEIITRFSQFTDPDEPCFIINVGLLTTGYDDPKIKTVVLGRLTLSANLFWQMIGRGTRGEKSKGTKECYVIDPIQLSDVFPLVGKYQPNVDDDVPFQKLGKKPEELALDDDASEFDHEEFETELRETVIDGLKDEERFTRSALLGRLSSESIASLFSSVFGMDEEVTQKSSSPKTMVRRLTELTWSELLSKAHADIELLLECLEILIAIEEHELNTFEEHRDWVRKTARALGLNKEEVLVVMDKRILLKLVHLLERRANEYSLRTPNYVFADHLDKFTWDELLAEEWAVAAFVDLLKVCEGFYVSEQYDLSEWVPKKADSLEYDCFDALGLLRKNDLWTALEELSFGESALKKRSPKEEIVCELASYAWDEVLSDEPFAELLYEALLELDPCDDEIEAVAFYLGDIDDLREDVERRIRSKSQSKKDVLGNFTRDELETFCEDWGVAVNSKTRKAELISRLSKLTWAKLLLVQDLLWSLAMDDQLFDEEVLRLNGEGGEHHESVPELRTEVTGAVTAMNEPKASALDFLFEEDLRDLTRQFCDVSAESVLNMSKSRLVEGLSKVSWAQILSVDEMVWEFADRFDLLQSPD
jgi:superfamily II DNA or RNA helicase